MKSVLISIQPKWCELIASGKKTVEVRKTKPKLETFKVYIYCTKARMPIRDNGRILMYEDDLAITNRWGQGKRVENPNGAMMDGELFLNGKVIGEFVCDKIYEIGYDYFYPVGYGVSKGEISREELYGKSCLSFNQMDDYLKMELGYGWHISNLVIYDKPRELSEFSSASSVFTFDDNGKIVYSGMKRPPQSWCYVEEMVGEDK